jgi:protein SCO1/2
MKNNIWIIAILLVGCVAPKEERLPVMGRKEITERTVNGQIVNDTTYHKIGDFSFVNQDSATVNNDTFDDKIYVADFFFTSCPTICPIMKTQMLRVYDTIRNYRDVKILSHTIDPEYDTVALLKDFAERLDVTSDVWHFVTGAQESIYEMAQRSYMVTALADGSEPGGFVHSGAFILVDKERRVRGLYDGTKPDQVDRLIRELAVLRREYEVNDK